MKTANTPEQPDQLVRALSHDMSANFMLLESSFWQLKKTLKGGSKHELTDRVAHVDACLRQSKRFLDDLARLVRTGNVKIEPTRVELSAVVDEVLFEGRELLAGRNIEVHVQHPLPVVWCNEGRLKQIVSNLVRNAVCHGCHQKQPRITIAQAAPPDAHRTNTGRAMVAFEVHDNGPGIDRRFHREIFLPGRRLTQTGAKGLGMGLAIVKKIVDHYDGLVYVDPHCKSGTTFVVSLPEPAPSEPKRPAWKLQLDGRHRERPRQLHGTFSPQPH